MSAEHTNGTATTICLVRHGETDWNVQQRIQGHVDTPLNALGREQARRAGLALRGEDWAALVSSPLARAWETAAIIAAELGWSAAIEPGPDLMERAYGAAEGMTGAELRASFPDGAIPREETVESVRARGMAAVARIARRHPGQRVLVVSHGGLINAILAVISHDEIGWGKTLLQNACLSIVSGDGDVWRIHAHNEVGHLC